MVKSYAYILRNAILLFVLTPLISVFVSIAFLLLTGSGEAAGIFITVIPVFCAFSVTSNLCGIILAMVFLRRVKPVLACTVLFAAQPILAIPLLFLIVRIGLPLIVASHMTSFLLAVGVIKVERRCMRKYFKKLLTADEDTALYRINKSSLVAKFEEAEVGFLFGDGDQRA